MLVALPIFIAVVPYRLISVRIQRGLIDAYSSNLERFQQNVDQNLRQIEFLSNVIVTSDAVRSIIHSGGVEDPPVYRYVSLSRSLRRIASPTHIVSDFFVHFFNLDVVANGEIKTDAPTFYRYLIEETSDFSRESVRNIKNGIFLPSTARYGVDRSRARLLYLRPLVDFENQTIIGCVIVTINKNAVEKLSSLIPGDRASVKIVTPNNIDILNSGPPLDDSLTYGKLTDLEGTIEHDSSHANVSLYKRSTVNEWIYLVEVPRDILLAPIRRAGNVMVALLSGYLVIAVILAWMFSMRNYRPFRRLASYLAETGKPAVAGRIDDVVGAIENEIERNVHLKRRLDRVMPQVRSDFLSNVLYGRINEEAAAEKYLTFLSINFPSKFFAVIVVEMHRDPDDGFGGPGEAEELALYEARRRLRTLVGTRHRGEIINTSESVFAMIVNFKANTSKQAGAELDKLLQIVPLLAPGVDRPGMRIGSSNIRIGINEVHRAYLEAIRVLGAADTERNPQVSRYDEEALAGGGYGFSIDDEMRLSNLTSLGDWSDVKQELDQIFSFHRCTGRGGSQMSRVLYMNLVCTSMRIHGMRRIQSHSRALELQDAIHDLVEQNAACDRVNRTVYSLYRFLCEVASSRERESNRHVQKAITYVSENYNDPNLSLTNIAEELGLQPQYLSGLFKKWQGENLSTCVAKLRITKAKELLLTSRFKIYEIARLVGYTSDIGFRKAFRRYEGISPGEYQSTPGTITETQRFDI